MKSVTNTPDIAALSLNLSEEIISLLKSTEMCGKVSAFSVKEYPVLRVETVELELTLAKNRKLFVRFDRSMDDATQPPGDLL